MRKEKYSAETLGHCKCSPQQKIVRFENSDLSSFIWGHRYTFLDDNEKLTNIFRCSNCTSVIHDSFVPEKTNQQ